MYVLFRKKAEPVRVYIIIYDSQVFSRKKICKKQSELVCKQTVLAELFTPKVLVEYASRIHEVSTKTIETEAFTFWDKN